MSFRDVAPHRPPYQNALMRVDMPEPFMSASPWWLVPLTLLGLAVLLFVKVAFSRKGLK